MFSLMLIELIIPDEPDYAVVMNNPQTSMASLKNVYLLLVIHVHPGWCCSPALSMHLSHH